MFKNILIPTDGSRLAARGIKAGVKLAKSLGARVTGVYEAGGIPIRKVCVVAEDLGDVGHVPAALTHGLARIQGLGVGKLLAVADRKSTRLNSSHQ